jgi:hypothetical protein
LKGGHLAPRPETPLSILKALAMSRGE